ncbi:hypothetical protein D9758_015256 [Tetrapyrgos nigripes]|uniref:Uncharacterized protein n=1 Tax=Tetrapyrgos nigripes TaxID=182062 RepID=A0A8H5FES4_9AGAR|nr:hypothetical protein D9758_015256 [Tetrapyrgos nigripes]
MGFGFGTPQRVEVDSGVHMENRQLNHRSNRLARLLLFQYYRRHQRDTRLPPELTGSSDYGGGVSGKGVRWEVGRGQQTSQTPRHPIWRSNRPLCSSGSIHGGLAIFLAKPTSNACSGLQRLKIGQIAFIDQPHLTTIPTSPRMVTSLVNPTKHSFPAPSDNLLKGGRPSTAYYGILDSSPASNWNQPLFVPSVKKCTPPDSPNFRNLRSTLVDGLARGTVNNSPFPFSLHNAVPQPPPDYEPFNFSLAHTMTFICHQGASFPHRADPCITSTHGHSLMKPS